MPLFNDIESIEKDFAKQSNKKIESFKQLLVQIRTNQASPSILDNVFVEAYGSTMKVKELATITSPEPRLLVIQAYDASTIANIEKAIHKADIGITPVNDGKLIRLPMPELNEERRKEIVTSLRSKLEEKKVEIRNLRREANEFIKKSQKNQLITEDDLKLSLDNIQKKTNNSIKQLDELSAQKEEEILKI